MNYRVRKFKDLNLTKDQIDDIISKLPKYLIVTGSSKRDFIANDLDLISVNIPIKKVILDLRKNFKSLIINKKGIKFLDAQLVTNYPGKLHINVWFTKQKYLMYVQFLKDYPKEYIIALHTALKKKALRLTPLGLFRVIDLDNKKKPIPINKIESIPTDSIKNIFKIAKLKYRTLEELSEKKKKERYQQPQLQKERNYFFENKKLIPVYQEPIQKQKEKKFHFEGKKIIPKYEKLKRKEREKKFHFTGKKIFPIFDIPKEKETKFHFKDEKIIPVYDKPLEKEKNFHFLGNKQIVPVYEKALENLKNLQGNGVIPHYLNFAFKLLDYVSKPNYILGGMCIEVDKTNITKRRFHLKDLTPELYKALKYISYNFENFGIFGSYIYRAQPYYNDIDGYEIVRIKDSDLFKDETFHKIKYIVQSVIKKILNSKEYFLADVKIGIDGDIFYGLCNLLDLHPNLDDDILTHDTNIKGLTNKINEFYHNNWISKDKYDTIIKLINSENNINNYSNLLEQIRLLIVLRWKANDILNGFIILHGNRKVSMEKAIKDGLFQKCETNKENYFSSMIKVDMIAYINNKFMEISNLFFIISNVIDIYIKGPQSIPKTLSFYTFLYSDFFLGAEILKFYLTVNNKFTNFVKFSKRIFARAIQDNDLDYIKLFSDLFHTDAMRIYEIYQILDTILFLLYNYKFSSFNQLTKDRIINTFNNLKFKLGLILTPITKDNKDEILNDDLTKFTKFDLNNHNNLNKINEFSKIFKYRASDLMKQYLIDSNLLNNYYVKSNNLYFSIK